MGNNLFGNKIAYIDLVLENCEYYRILKDDVNYVQINSIKKSADVNLIGQFSEIITCDEAFISINNKDYRTEQEKTHGDKHHIEFTKRMEIYRDITSICIGVLSDDEKDIVEKQYYVPYLDKYEGKEISSVNLLQKVRVNNTTIDIEIKSKCEI